MEGGGKEWNEIKWATLLSKLAANKKVRMSEQQQQLESLSLYNLSHIKNERWQPHTFTSIDIF